MPGAESGRSPRGPRSRRAIPGQGSGPAASSGRCCPRTVVGSGPRRDLEVVSPRTRDGPGRFRAACPSRRGRPYQGGSARAVGGTRGKAGEPSRLVAGLPRRGRAPAPTPAGLEPRRQGERRRHLGRPPRAPPHGRWRDDRRLRLGRRGRGRRLGRLGRTGGAPRAGGTRDGGAADELQLELLAGVGLGLPSRRRGQGGPLPSFTRTSSIPDGLAAASGGTVTPRR
jgi:hypothetical protein